MSAATSVPRSSLVVRLVLCGALVAGAAWAWRTFAIDDARVAPVTREKAVSVVTGSVIVRAEAELQLKSEVGGRVASTELKIGQRYPVGAPLVQIDPADLRLEIDRIESEYASLKARLAVGSAVELELKTAREALANQERMFELGNLAEAEITRARRSVQGIEQRLALEKVGNESALAVAENTLAVKRRQLEKMTVRAPFDCVAAEVFIPRPGDLIAAGAPLARLISVERLVECRIAEESISGVAVGQTSSVRFNGYGPTLFDAKVTQILPTADATTQRYVVYLAVDLSPEKLVPGLTGEASVLLAERADALVVERRAVVNSQVLVVREGRVEVRSVKVGFTSLFATELLEGAQEGEWVITDELEKFQPGDRVRPIVQEDIKR